MGVYSVDAALLCSSSAAAQVLAVCGLASLETGAVKL